MHVVNGEYKVFCVLKTGHRSVKSTKIWALWLSIYCIHGITLLELKHLNVMSCHVHVRKYSFFKLCVRISY